MTGEEQQMALWLQGTWYRHPAQSAGWRIEVTVSTGEKDAARGMAAF